MGAGPVARGVATAAGAAAGDDGCSSGTCDGCPGLDSSRNVVIGAEAEMQGGCSVSVAEGGVSGAAAASAASAKAVGGGGEEGGDEVLGALPVVAADDDDGSTARSALLSSSRWLALPLSAGGRVAAATKASRLLRSSERLATVLTFFSGSACTSASVLLVLETLFLGVCFTFGLELVVVAVARRSMGVLLTCVGRDE